MQLAEIIQVDDLTQQTISGVKHWSKKFGGSVILAEPSFTLHIFPLKDKSSEKRLYFTLLDWLDPRKEDLEDQITEDHSEYKQVNDLFAAAVLSASTSV